MDADASDGICRTATGTCTLRAAVMAANAQPGSTIELPAAHYRLTIPPNPDQLNGRTADPTKGDLNVLEPTTIRGAGRGRPSSTPTRSTGSSAWAQTRSCPTSPSPEETPSSGRCPSPTPAEAASPTAST
ncbi:hypothetical protein ACQF36_28105 [Streptomyces sp. Marseille-Q5077]|uniref:hypothetical protein n=1 Tax=Streptomyces sp. Marseille-Q5077 TaxID=3418995 RepID=UPI003CFBDCD1